MSMESNASREDLRLYRSLFARMDEGCVLADVMFDAHDRPVDITYIESNPAAVGMLGMDLSGRRMSELETNDANDWHEIWGRVARSGQGERLERFAARQGRWYDVYVFKPEPDNLASRRVAALFRDITERRRHERRDALLLKLADALRPLASPADIQGVATALLRQELDVGWCFYADYEEHGPVAVIQKDAARPGLPSLAGRHDMSDIPSYVALVRTGQVIDIPDFADCPLFSPRVVNRYTAIGIRSLLGVPLVKGGRLVAQLSLHDTHPRQWTEEEALLVQEVAERTWAAVELARTERRTAELNSFLVRFSEAAQGLTDAVEIARVACVLVAQAMGVDRAYWAEVDTALHEYVVGASFCAPGASPISGRFPIDDWEPLSGLLRRGLPVVVHDTRSDHRLAPPLLRGYAQLGIGADLAAPVTFAGELRACLAVNQLLPRLWSPDEVALVQSIASRCWTEVERARAAAAMRDSQEQLRLIAHLVPDLLWRSNAEGAAYWVNRRWSEYTGAPEESAMGNGWRDFVHPEDLPRVNESRKSALATGTPWQSEHRLRRADGQWRWHMVRAEPWRDGSGATRQWFGADTDIHQQRAGRDELQAQVAARTAALRQLLLRVEGVQDEERRRIARELHDSLGQYLSNLGLAVDALREVPVDEVSRMRLQRLHEAMQQLDRELDRIIFILRPTALDDCGLGDAVAGYVDTWSTVTGIPVEFEMQGLDGGRLEPQIEGAVFRVVQEALNNVAKHAGASQVGVSLVRRRGLLFGCVEDDGRGFEAEQPERMRMTGWGLLGMRERIEALGGRLAIESSPDAGVSVQWQVPLEQERPS